MQIVRDVAGYSLGRSDIMRRAMSKKDRKAMDVERQVFIYGLQQDGKTIVEGAVNRGIDEKTAIEIFDKIAAFAEYAFNKSHAAAYAVVAYQTAYLKCYYPLEFMAAMLNSLLGNEAQTARYIGYCREHGIQVLPPDVNTSVSGFSPVKGEKAIRFGLSAVKNVGIPGVKAIVSEREENGVYTSLDDFAQRTTAIGEVNKRMVESLIKAGAFDFTGFSRKSLLSGYEAVLDGAASRSKNSLAGQFSLFDDLAVSQEVQIQSIREIGEYPKLQLLMLEKEMLGVYLSGHPLERYRRQIQKIGFDLSKITVETDESGESIVNEEIMALDNKDVQFIGIITSVRKKATKSGTMMAFLTVEDLYSSVTALVFPAALTKFNDTIYEDAIVLVTGKLSVRDEEQPTVLVNAITPVHEDEEEAGCSVFLRITEQNRDALLTFKTMLEEIKGNTPVILYYEKERMKQEISHKISHENEVMAKLNGIFGAENVKIVKK